jgi:UDPglucose 6-dehydrogenase
MKISIIGAGYVGLVTAAGLAKAGHNILLIDKDTEKLKLINNKTPPFYERDLEKFLKKFVPNKIKTTTNLLQAVERTDVIFICVGTPSRKNGKMYDNQIKQVSQDIGKALKNKKSKHLIVVKSTVVPETTEKTIIPLIEKYSGKKYPKDFGVCMNPEFLREGQAIKDFLNPDRIVMGVQDAYSMEICRKIYKKFNYKKLFTKIKEAELIKYASNCFLASRISLINEIGNICKLLNADVNIIAKGIGMDKRIGPYFLKSGIGFGGSCFPKDVSALISKGVEKGYYAKILNSVLEVNKEQPLKLIELIEDRLKNIKDIALLGLTFKAFTDDIRESPSIDIIKSLLTEKINLYVYDPIAMPKVKEIFPNLNYTKSAQEAVDKAQLILILTEWPEFRKLNFENKPVIDGKNLFEKNKRPKNYEGVCW